MGVGSSLQNPKSHEPPPLPPPFGHVGRMSRFSRLSSASDQPSTSENVNKMPEKPLNDYLSSIKFFILGRKKSRKFSQRRVVAKQTISTESSKSPSASRDLGKSQEFIWK